ncbi:MAG: peptidylprolyl isomerase [Chloroflexota bacterium]
MSPSRRPSRRVPPKGRSLRHDPAPAPLAGHGGEAGETAATSELGTTGVRPGSRSANRAAKRAVGGVRPKTQQRGGSRRRSSNSPLIVLGIGAAVIVAAVILLGNPFGTPAASPTAAAAVTPVPSHGDGTCPTEQPASLAAGNVRTVTIETTKGTIVMKIDGALAPVATGNFVALVSCHFYDGIGFHRLMPGFVIQGGDPEGTGGGGPGYTIKDDPITTTYHRGTVAMARSSQPDSQGSQFFIVLADDADSTLSGTDPGYAILGEVTSGMDVVDAIAAMPNSGGQEGRALEPVIMTSVTVSGGTTPSAAPTSSTAPTAAPTTASTAAPSSTPAP